MKSKVMVSLLVGVTGITAPVLSFADRDFDHDRGNDQGRGYEQRGNADWQGNRHWAHDRDDDRRWDHNHDGHWDRGRGRDWDDRRDHRDWRDHDERERVVVRDRVVVRPYQEWRRGEYLPVTYRAPGYYVNDWRAYRGYNLYEPPRGYRWVRVNGDFILVAIATNVIAQILLGGH